MSSSNGRDNNSDDAYSSMSQNDSFNLNSRIMFCSIVFLTMVIIFAFIHHVYTKYCTRRPVPPHNGQTTLAEVVVQDNNDNPSSSSEPPKLGLHPLVIASLPTFVITRSSNDDKDGGMLDSSTTECPICLNGLEDEEVGRVLPNCRHVFHANCVDMWLVSNSTCPVCRMEVDPSIKSRHRVSAGASSGSSPPAASQLQV